MVPQQILPHLSFCVDPLLNSDKWFDYRPMSWILPTLDLSLSGPHSGLTGKIGSSKVAESASEMTSHVT